MNPNLPIHDPADPQLCTMENLSPEKTGLYYRSELCAVIERKAASPDGAERYELELTPPPRALDGLSRPQAFALAAEYTRRMEKLIGEI